MTDENQSTRTATAVLGAAMVAAVVIGYAMAEVTGRLDLGTWGLFIALLIALIAIPAALDLLQNNGDNA